MAESGLARALGLEPCWKFKGKDRRDTGLAWAKEIFAAIPQDRLQRIFAQAPARAGYVQYHRAQSPGSGAFARACSRLAFGPSPGKRNSHELQLQLELLQTRDVA